MGAVVAWELAGSCRSRCNDLIVLLVESVGLLALNATCFGYVRLRGSLGWSSSDGNRRGLTLR